MPGMLYNGAMKAAMVRFILSYLRFWAGVALSFGDPTVVGITGSIGKSSARDAGAAVLKNQYETYVIEKGNSEIGVPLGILGLHVESLGFQTPLRSIMDFIKILIAAPFRTFHLKAVQYLIVEMAVDEPDPPKNMEYLLTVVKPDISVFLNVFPVHTMQFEKVVPADVPEGQRENAILQAIAKEKGKIITMSGCKTGIYNAENSYVQDVISKIDKNTNPVSLLAYGQKGNFAVNIVAHEVSLNETRFVFKVNQKNYKLSIKDYVLPKEYGEIFAAAVLVGQAAGIDTETAIQNLERSFVLPPGRSTILPGIHGTTIIDSSYNASRASVVAFLELLAELKKKTGRPVGFLFGDMRELGNEAPHEHAIVAEKIGEVVDRLYLVGPLTKEYVLPVVSKKIKDVVSFDTPYDAGMYLELESNLPSKTILLVKGSQNTIFLEEAIKKILLHKKDEKFLCRQTAYWLEKKSHKS